MLYPKLHYLSYVEFKMILQDQVEAYRESNMGIQVVLLG